MSKNPVVDVIMPTYNGLPFLKEAVESVMAQTYDHWRLYIIDDGSTDGTAAYLKTITDKRISFSVAKKNCGPSAARNLGIEQSSSEFVAFLDADDVWYPTKLDQQLNTFKADLSLGLVYGSQVMIDEGGQQTDSLTAKLRGNAFKSLLTGNRIVGSASMVLIRRKVLEDVGGFLTQFEIGEDWELWLRIAHRYRIDFVNEPLVMIRELSISSQRKYLRNAKQLLRIKDFILKEFSLRGWSRRILESHLYLHAAIAYFSAGEREKSKQSLKTGLKLNRLVLRRYNIHTWFICLRILNYHSVIWRIRNHNQKGSE